MICKQANTTSLAFQYPNLSNIQIKISKSIKQFTLRKVWATLATKETLG